MSDVSGIPYMGPMGQGNLFASAYPALSGGGNASWAQTASTYMPEVINNQNALTNLFNTPGGGGGFGRATDYYSGLGASYSAAGMSPFGVFNDPGTGPSSGGASPYQTTPNVFETGASGVSYPGAGAIDWSGLFGSVGSGGQSAYDYGSLFGSGAAAAAPDAYSYGGGLNVGSLLSGGGISSGGADMFGGLAGGLGGAYQGPNNPIDWGGLFSGSGGGGGPVTDPYPNMAWPGGQNSPMTLPQQQPPDFGSLFGQGVGGTGGAPQPPPYTSGIAPDETGGQSLSGGAPPAALYQQPYTSGIAPDETGGRSFGERFDALGGSAPMGDSAPDGTGAAKPAPLPETSRMSDALLGYTPREWPESAYDKPSDPAMDQPLPGNPYTDPQGGGVAAADLSEQARAKLAELMNNRDGREIELKADPKDVVAPEVPVETPAGAIPMPVARPAGASAATDVYPGANPPRPPANIPFTVEPGKEAKIRAVQPRLSAAVQGGAAFLPPGYTVEAYSGERSGKGQAYHRGGHAMDVRIIGPDGPIPSEGADKTGMYTLLARGVKTWAAQNDPGLLQTSVGGLGWGGAFGTQRGSSGGTNIIPDLMHFDLGGSRGALRPEVQFGRLQQLTAEERNAMPAYIPELGANQVPLDAPGAGPYSASQSVPLPQERPAEAPPLEQRPGVNQGQDITAPPTAVPGGTPFVNDGTPFGPSVPPDYKPPAAAAVKHSGLELARANIDTPIEQIALERGGQKAVDQINFMAMGKTPRQLSEQYGGMFMDRAEPLFKSLGITRQDFEKAATLPSAKQDLKMRFADFDGLSRGDPTSGGFTPFPDFRQSGDVEDRRNDPGSGRRGLAALLGMEKPQAADTSWADNIVTPETPLSRALGAQDVDAAAQGIHAAEQDRTGAILNDVYQNNPLPETAQRFNGSAPTSGAGSSIFDDRFPQEGAFAGAASMRDFQSPANDYDTFQQPASRADLAAQIAEPGRVKMDFGGGFSSSPEPRKGGVGPEMDAPTPEFMQTIAEVESDFNPNQKTGSYKGLYQLSDKEFQKYGGQGSIFDPDENARVATAKMTDEGQKAQDALGRALTPVEQYMVHQQGLYGTLAHLANPDQAAWKSFQQASSNSEAKSKAAIWKNMTPEMKGQFGNDVNNVTSRDFIKLWTDRYNALQRPGKQ